VKHEQTKKEITRILTLICLKLNLVATATNFA